MQSHIYVSKATKSPRSNNTQVVLFFKNMYTQVSDSEHLFRILHSPIRLPANIPTIFLSRAC